MTEPLLACHGLRVGFRRYDGALGSTESWPVDGLDVTVSERELVGMIGASGAGKSLFAHALLGILPGNAAVQGTVTYAGAPLTPERQAKLRGREIALVPQSVAALDPLMRAGALVRRTAELAGYRGAAADEVAAEALTRHGLAPETARLYPHQLSGGMARRVLIACARVSGARLVLADEPTPGLDLPVARQVMTDLRAMADDGRAVLVITHDLGVALPYLDRVVVLRGGRTVDEAPQAAFHGEGEALSHSYTRALWRALPANGMHADA